MAFTPQQAAFRFENDNGSESGSTFAAAQNANLTITDGGGNTSYRLRVGVQETGGTSGSNPWKLQYSKNGGSWADVTTASSNVKAFDSTNLSGGSATTQRLTGLSGTFSAGQWTETGVTGSSGPNANRNIEFLFTVQTIDADLAGGDTLDFRVLYNGAVLSGGYAVTPTITNQANNVTGSLGKALASATLAATAVLLIAGSAAPALGDVTLDSTSTISAAPGASLNATLAGLGISAFGNLPLGSDLAAQLGNVTLLSNATLPVLGSVDETLDTATVSAAGSLIFAAATPDFKIRSIRWTLNRSANLLASGWTGARTIVANPWQSSWRASVQLAPTPASDIGALRAFLVSRQGAVLPFRIYATESAQNANSGVTVSSTAAQGANSMSISGAATGLLDGQYVTVNGQLLLLTADQSGALLAFEPKLKQAAATGTKVVTARPYALVHMADSRARWSVDLGGIYDVSFDVEEAPLEPDGTAPEA